MQRLYLYLTLLIALFFMSSMASAGSVYLTWEKPTTNADGTVPLADHSGYNLYYGVTSRGAAQNPSQFNYDYMTVINDPNTTSITISNLPDGAYFFSITAFDSATPSNESSFSTSEIRVDLASTTTHSLEVSWQLPTANADGSTPLTDLRGFNVHYGVTSRGNAQAPSQFAYDHVEVINDPNATSHLIANLPDGIYFVSVTAFDSATPPNESLFSAPEITIELTSSSGGGTGGGAGGGTGGGSGGGAGSGTGGGSSGTPPVPASGVGINFQPGGSNVPEGYEADSGVLYDANLGYGWDRTLSSRERQVNADVALDTFVYAGASEIATWQYDLPNGDYWVSLASGDAGWDQGPHQVMVEGLVAIDGVSTAKDVYEVVAELLVTVNDGQLTVQIGSDTGNTMLNYIHIAPVEEPQTMPPDLDAMVQINFQPGGSNVPEGYEADSGALYDANLGYGWDRTLNSRERQINADAALDTFVYTGASNIATWQYDLPNGDYWVSLASGDAGWDQGPHQVMVEGLVAIDGVSTAKDVYEMVTELLVTVNDGQLTVQIGSDGGNTMLNYIHIAPVEEPQTMAMAQINFQPSGSSAPEGYEADSGALYDANLGYGWDRTLSARERQVNADVALDTFVYASRNKIATWQYDLPNGDYWVSLASGDAGWAQGPHQVMVEGLAAIDGVSTAKDVYEVVTELLVTVNDGQLTVQIGSDGGNTMLNYIQITSTE